MSIYDDEIMDKQQAYSRATALCSKSEKCISDIRKKLYDWKVESEDHDALIDILIKNRYIDEARFAVYFVRDKYRFNSWGKVKIRYQLQQKQIPSELIDCAMAEIDEAEYRQNLIHALAVKNKSIKSEDIYERRQKLMRFAAGRGFSPDEIVNSLANILK